MPEFTPACSLEELPAEGIKAIDLQGQPILVGRIQRQLVACLDRCPHAGAPLRLGKLKGEELTCARHGWTFNLVTGRSVPDDPRICLTQLPMKVDGNQLLIGLPSSPP